MKIALCLAAPILFILALLFRQLNLTQPHAASAVSTDPMPRAQGPTAVVRSNLRASDQQKTRELPLVVVETRRKINEMMLKEADLYSGERKQNLVKGAMMSLEAGLGPILKSWQMDSAKSNDVMRVFQELERERMEIYVEQLKYGTKGIPERKNAQLAEEELAKFQLESIVGTDRAEELMKARRDVRTNSAMQGIKNANATKR